MLKIVKAEKITFEDGSTGDDTQEMLSGRYK